MVTRPSSLAGSVGIASALASHDEETCARVYRCIAKPVGTYAQFESVFTSPEDTDRVRCAGILWCRTESHQCLCAIAGPCFRKAMTRLSGLHRS